MATSRTTSTTSPRTRALPGSSQTDRLRGSRWLVLAGVALVALNLRTAVTAAAPVLQEVRADVAISATVAGVLGMAPTIAFAAFGAATPLLARWIRLEQLAVLAMVLAAGGQLLRVLVPGTGPFLALSFLALGGMGIGNVVLPPLVKRYFPDRVAAVTGLYVLLLSAGTALPPLLAVPVADAAGWRVSVGGWALLAVVAALPWLGVIAAHRRVPDDGGPPAAVGRWPVTAVLRSRVAWGLAGMLGMTSLNTYAILTWLPTLLVEAGASRTDAALLLSLYAAVGIPLSIGVPWAAARLHNQMPLVVGFTACYLLGYTGLLVAPLAAPVVWVVAAGAGPGAFPLALTLVNLRSRSTEGSALLSGFSQGVGYTVAGAGPLVFGALHEASGSWRIPLLFLVATLVVQVGAAIVVCRPRDVEDDLGPPPDSGKAKPSAALPSRP